MSLALRSSLWVAAQFALIALMLAWPGHWRIGVPAELLGAAALALGVWVLSHNRPGNFRVRPQPKPGARLVLGGPYRFMRHPMYTSSVGRWRTYEKFLGPLLEALGDLVCD